MKTIKTTFVNILGTVVIVFGLMAFSAFLCNAANAQINTSPYKFTEIFRIGDEASGASVFIASHVHSQIAVNSANQLFVGGGWRVSPVMSFSDRGNFIGFVGAEGEGPGEFKTSSSVVVGQGIPSMFLMRN